MVQYLVIMCIKMQYFPLVHNHFLVLRNTYNRSSNQQSYRFILSIVK